MQNHGFAVESEKTIFMIKALYRIVIGGECWDREVETSQLPQLDTHDKFLIIINFRKLVPFRIDEIFDSNKETWYSHRVWFKSEISDDDYKKVPTFKESLTKRIEQCGWVKSGLEKDLK